MKPVQVIDVDTKIPFNLPSLLDIELVGPDKRTQVINSIHTRSVARGVINKTSNKNTADLRDSRSKEFMIELDKSSPKTYFARFKMATDRDSSIQRYWQRTEHNPSIKLF